MKTEIIHARRVTNIVRIIASLLLGTALLAGCAGQQAVKPPPVFFPPAPDEPRIQFLKDISGSTDVEGTKKKEFFSLGAEEDTGKPIVKPYGLRYAGGKLYVCDSQGPPSVIIIDFRQKTFSYLAGNEGLGRLRKPLNVAVDKDGNLFVADVLLQTIMTYDPAGKFIGTIGKGTNMKPVDVAVDEKFVYVLDTGGNEIKVFDRKSGNLQRSIGNPKDNPAKEGLSMATNFFFDGKGLFYVTNVGTGYVIILDKDGHINGKFGGLGDSFGEFARPKGIAVDGQRRIWVVDSAFQNVQLFDETYRLLMFFGAPPLESGALNLPAGIAVTTDNLEYFQTLADPSFVVEQVIFVANQSGNAKVSVYGLGHLKEPKATPAGEGNKPGGGTGQEGEKKPADIKEGTPDRRP